MGLHPWDFLGKSSGVGCHFLLQGIFLNQGLNPGLLHCRQILYQLSHKGSPRILEWVAIPFSRESSWTRDPTQVSCIAGRFFTIWVTRKPNKSRKEGGLDQCPSREGLKEWKDSCIQGSPLNSREISWDRRGALGAIGGECSNSSVAGRTEWDLNTWSLPQSWTP